MTLRTSKYRATAEYRTTMIRTYLPIILATAAERAGAETMSRLQMTVNGTAVDIEVPESRYLSEVLREDLRLTGTKIGCNEAECGICTVLVNGTAVVSCVFPAFKAQGAQVETIEGVSRDGNLHALQQAFLDHGAVQCGICTPGPIMTAKGLLDRSVRLEKQ